MRIFQPCRSPYLKCIGGFIAKVVHFNIVNKEIYGPFNTYDLKLLLSVLLVYVTILFAKSELEYHYSKSPAHGSFQNI